MRTTQDCSASNALVSSAAVQPPCAAAPATRVALGAHDRAALEGAARKASRRAWLSACALLGIAVSPLGASAVSHAAGPGFSGQEPIVEAQSGPYLEWRNLAGEVRPMGLTQTPKGELENLFGHWMRPMGLAAMPLLDEASETVAKIGLIGGDHVIAQGRGAMRAPWIWPDPKMCP